VLAFFYSVIPNYAVAITLLTLLVMVVVTPLTLKGTRSMMMMQQLQPEMKKIQTQYKDDRQKLNEELLKFYKENNINPVGGCLPLLVQMPVFIILYQVLRGLTRRVSDMGFDVGWVSGQLGIGNGSPPKPPSLARPFDPAYLNHDSAMYQNLHGATTMSSNPFNLDLAESCSQALSKGLWHALPFVLLIVIVGVTGFVQQRQIQGRNPNAQVNPQQQMIMKVMPIFLPVISFGLPAGLVLYFAVSNLYRIGQQAFISRSIYGVQKDKSARRGLGGLIDVRSREEKPAKGAIDADTTEATKTRGAKPSTAATKSTPAKATGGKTSPAKKPPAKRTPAKGRTTTSPRGGASTKTGTGGTKPTGSTGTDSSQGGATLQPRARKNKKR